MGRTVVPAVWCLDALLRSVPEQLSRTTGSLLSDVAYWPLGIRRRVVEEQLAASFPGMDPKWVQEITRSCYRHFGRELATVLANPSRIERNLAKIADHDDAAAMLERAITLNGGAVIVTGHIGNFWLAAAYAAWIGFPTTTVAQRQRSLTAISDRRFTTMQERMGLELIYRDSHPRRLVQALHNGRVLVLVADQHTRRGSAPVEFLGRHAWTTLGPARLCLGARVPLFLAVNLRDGEGYHLRFEKIYDGDVTDEGIDQLALTRRWILALERYVRDHPEQYFWFHRRWKGACAAEAWTNEQLHAMVRDNPDRGSVLRS